MFRNFLYKIFIHDTNRTVVNFLGYIQSNYWKTIISTTIQRITFIKEFHKNALKFPYILNNIFFLVTFFNTKIFIKIPTHIIRSQEGFQLLPIKYRNICKRTFYRIPRKMVNRMNKVLETIFNIFPNIVILQIFHSISFVVYKDMSNIKEQTSYSQSTSKMVRKLMYSFIQGTKIRRKPMSWTRRQHSEVPAFYNYFRSIDRKAIRKSDFGTICKGQTIIKHFTH